jgi:membrane protein implicated in regulation of membrane protease activity
VDFWGLDSHWWWLIGAALLGILEIFLPGIFLAWIAAAAALTGIVVALLPISLPFELALFGLLAMAAVFGGRRHYERNPVESSDPMLNDRTARLIGQQVTVVTAIENGEGRVKVGDGVWAARGPDAAAGSRMVVTGADGACLRVAPAAAIEGPPAGAA